MEIRLLGVDGVEDRVAMMYRGGGGKIHRDQNVFFLLLFLFSFFVPKPTARVLYF